MKFTILTIAGSLGVTFAQNSSGCINASDFAADHDFFPDKVNATTSLYWDIQYFNTYKILRNELADKSYLLYQCGTSPPSLPDTFAQTLSVPVEGFAISSTTDIPYIELLGARNLMKGWVGYEGGMDAISSPCVKKLMDEGEFLGVTDASNSSSTELLALQKMGGEDMIAFVDDFSQTALKDVSVLAYKETTNLGGLEWVKYFSVFFNLEATANKVFNDAAAQYKSVAEAAQAVEKPTIVWAYYTNSSGADGFDIAECPNYYCEYAEACGAEFLTSREGSNVVSMYGETYVYMNVTEFVAFAASADHWIYASNNWEDAYGVYKTELDTLPSVQNQQVFDYQKGGQNDWFESRLAEPDVVLADFCDVVGSATGLRNRVWFRNVFNETIVEDTICVAVDASGTSSPGPLSASTSAPTQKTTAASTSSAASTFLSSIAFAVMGFMFVSVM